MPSIEQLTKLLAAEPNDPFLLYGLAQEFAKVPDVAKACEYFDRCLAADPKYCYAYYHKARVLIAAKRFDEAKAVIASGKAVALAAGDSHARSEIMALEYDID